MSYGRNGWCAAITVAMAAILTASVASAEVNRRVERPAAQAALPTPGAPSVSWMWKTINFEGQAPNPLPTLDFEYFVDSHAQDMLKVYVDGTVKFQKSGRNQQGRASIPVNRGNRVIQFEYSRSGPSKAGLDTAWVDNVSIQHDSKPPTLIDFDQAQLGVPSGWTTGGTAGGMEVVAEPPPLSMGRPQSHAFIGYQLQPTISYTERTVNVVGNASMTFRYFVDSEEGYDIFRVRRNGEIVFEISGPNRTGWKRIDFGHGNHTFRFEWEKDFSVDYGLDVARVSEVIFKGNTNAVFDSDYFEGQTIGAVPSQWTSGGAGGGWVIQRPTQPRVYVDPWSQSPPITIDGRINPETSTIAEYQNHTGVTLPDFGAGRTGARLALRAGYDTEELVLAHRAAAATTGLGDESGVFLVMFDEDHWLTMTGRSACADPTQPGPEDRLLVFEYQSAVGTGSASLLSSEQAVGDCTGWQTATSAQLWPATFAARELADHPGRLDIEARVVTRSAAGVAGNFWVHGLMGLVVVHSNGNIAGTVASSIEHLPAIERLWSSWPWDRVDASETIHLWEPLTELGDGPVDGVPTTWMR